MAIHGNRSVSDGWFGYVGSHRSGVWSGGPIVASAIELEAQREALLAAAHHHDRVAEAVEVFYSIQQLVPPPPPAIQTIGVRFSTGSR